MSEEQKKAEELEALAAKHVGVCHCDRGPHWHSKRLLCGKCGGVWQSPIRIELETPNVQRRSGSGMMSAFVERERKVLQMGLSSVSLWDRARITFDIGKALLVDLEGAEPGKITERMRQLGAVVRRFCPEAADVLESFTAE
jgi:hypothetical protein